MAWRNFPTGPFTVEQTTGMQAVAEREAIKSLLTATGGNASLNGIVNYIQANASGVLQGDLAVQASSTPDGLIHIRAGQAFIQGKQDTFQGIYHISNDTTDLPIAVGAASATYRRIDAVICWVADADYTGGVQSPPIQSAIIQGSYNTGGGNPIPPTSPYSNSILLAYINVPTVAGGTPTVVQSSWIQDMRPVAGRRPYFAIRAALTASPSNIPAGFTYNWPYPNQSSVYGDSLLGWSVAGSAYIAKVAGWYRMHSQALVTASGAADATGAIRLGASVGGFYGMFGYYMYIEMSANGSQFLQLNAEGLVYLKVGDVWSPSIAVDGGTSIVFTPQSPTDDRYSRVSGEWISP